MDMQLNPEEQIQGSRPSSIYDVEESCTKENLRVEKADTKFEFVSKRVSASNSSAREMVKLKEVMLGESKAQEKTHICEKVACTVLCTMVVLVLAKIKVHYVKVECIEDYTQCANRAKVVATKYTKAEVGEQTVPGLREGSARAVKMLTEMWTMRGSSLADELSRKMAIMRRQDELLSGNGTTTVQILTANTQLKAKAFKKLAMMEMVVELTKPEGCKNPRTRILLLFYENQAVELGEDEFETSDDEEFSMSAYPDIKVGSWPNNPLLKILTMRWRRPLLKTV